MTSTAMNPISAKEARNQVCLVIGRFFYENGLAFNVGNSLFVNIYQSIGSYGHGLKPPSMHELSTWILKEKVKTAETIIKEVKKT